MKNRVIKGLLIGVCILSVFLIYTWLTTYNPEDHKNELTHFSNKYVDHADLSASVYKDSFKNKDNLFTLYENNGEYYLVWSHKSIWSLGRYRVQGGNFPNSSADADKSQLSEFQEFDSSGLVYILFGKYKQSPIELNITKADGSTNIKKYEIDGDHTFVVYTSEYDCTITPIFDNSNDLYSWILQASRQHTLPAYAYKNNTVLQKDDQNYLVVHLHIFRQK